MPGVFFIFIQVATEFFNFSYLHFLDLQIISCVNKLYFKLIIIWTIVAATFKLRH